MCGSKHATSTSQVTIPADVLARYNAVNKRAETAASTPFKAFGNTASDYVAQMNAQQNAGISDINATAGSYQPYMDAAKAATTSGMGPSYEGIDKYMSPYIQNVADTTGAMMRQANEQAQSGALGAAAASGAFGGDRAGVAAANLNQQNQMAYGKTMADIYNQGYGQAIGAHQADLARQMAGGEQLAGLGAQSQALGLQGAQAKIGAGTMQQQTEQAGKDAMVNRFMQEQGYPFQVAQFLANIAMGTGALSGTTTTSKQPLDMWGNPYASGGAVGDEKVGHGGVGSEGYVPTGDLPVGQLMISSPPQSGGNKDSGLGGAAKIAALFAGKAYGGGVSGRHGYAGDGFVDPFGSPEASPWSPDDERKHNAAIAAAEAALHPNAPPAREYNVGESYYHKSPNGTIFDAYNQPVNIGQSEQVRNEIARQDKITEQARLAGSDDMVSQFRQSQADAAATLAERNKNALTGMYQGNFPVSQAAKDYGPAPAATGVVPSTPVIPNGDFWSNANAASAQPVAGVALQHPVSPMSDFWAKLGASDSAIANAEKKAKGLAAAQTPTAPAVDTGLRPDYTGPNGFKMPGSVMSDKPFMDKAAYIASDLGVPLQDLMRVMGAESGYNPSAVNGLSGATGLIQFIPSTARSLGTSVSELSGMNRSQQLDYVHRYLKDTLGGVENPSFNDLYAAINYPSAVGKPDNTVLYSSGSRAYDGNKPLDLNQDGQVTKGEAGQWAYANGNLSSVGAGGLGAANMNAPTRNGFEKPYEDRNAIGKFFHNEDGTINQSAIGAILSGLAGMTQGRTPIAALLSGLGAGYGGYAATQKQLADIASTAAGTNRTNVAAARERYGVTPGMGPTVVTPDMSGVQPVARVMPYMQQDLTGTIFGTPAAQDAFAAAGNVRANWNDGTMPKQDAIMADLGASYDAATASRPMTMEQLNALPSMSGPGVSGWGGDARAKFVNIINTLGRAAGLPDTDVSGSDIDIQQAILNKVGAVAAAASAQGFDQTSRAAMNDLERALPSMNLPPEANAKIMSAILIAQQSAQDRYDLASQFRTMTGGIAEGYNKLFNETYSHAYDAERNALEHLISASLTAGKGQSGMTVLEQLTSGRLTPEQAQSLIEHAIPGEATPNMYRYFTSSQGGN